MIKVFTTFSGYDSQCLAFKYANVDFDLIGWSEIDSKAIAAHNLLFPKYKDRNYGDITKVDWENVPDFDFLTYSSPCTDISVAGYGKGIEKGSGTRSSLLWEIEKAIQVKKPKFLLMENVFALVGAQYIKAFEQWLEILKTYGYKSYYQIIKADDYNIPQKRKRVFCVSIREDINQTFEFPKPMKLTYTLNNVFDNTVKQQYYLSYEKEASIVDKMIHFDDYMPSIRNGEFRIRHVTPQECFKLMGVRDDDIQLLCNSSIGNTQLYKMAGNSIVVDCLIYIYNNLFKDHHFDLPQHPSEPDNHQKVMIGYSRNDDGTIKNRHPLSISNVLTTFTGNGWSTDIYILEI